MYDITSGRCWRALVSSGSGLAGRGEGGGERPLFQTHSNERFIPAGGGRGTGVVVVVVVVA